MPRRNHKVELIARVPLFAGCSKRELARVASLADELDVPAGRELTVEGRSGREFCVLVSGTADVRRRGRRVATLGDGDFFGEIALILDAPRSATVVTSSAARLLVIERTAFRHLLETLPSLQTKVLEALAVRLAAESL